MNNFSRATIETIAGGAAARQFDFELQRAIDNCLDPNTDSNATRTVTLKVVVKPGPDRKDAMLTFQATSKLAPDAPGTDMVYISQGKAYVQDMQQMRLDELVEEHHDSLFKMGVSNDS